MTNCNGICENKVLWLFNWVGDPFSWAWRLFFRLNLIIFNNNIELFKDRGAFWLSWCTFQKSSYWCGFLLKVRIFWSHAPLNFLTSSLIFRYLLFIKNLTTKINRKNQPLPLLQKIKKTSQKSQPQNQDPSKHAHNHNYPLLLSNPSVII